MHAELSQLRSAPDAPWRTAPAAPTRLFYPADAARLDAVVRDHALPAHDWRLGHEPALVRHGVDLVERFLAARRDTTGNPLRERFRQATLANFNPRGTHFDGFVVRLFEHADGAAAAGRQDYALGMRTAALPARLGQAVYVPERQRAIVASIYQACEDYVVGAVARFGERCLDDFLTPCWDTFRHEVGPFLMRFRPPALAHEQEWVALVPARGRQCADQVTFPIVDNRLVPTAALALGARPLDAIAIGPALPFGTTCEALRAWLGQRRMPGLAIVPLAGNQK